MAQIFVNNLAVAITASMTATQLTAEVDSTANFPVLGVDDWFHLTIASLSEGVEVAWEVVKVTSWTGTTLTIVRAQDNTAGQIWTAGDEISLRVTASDIGSKIAATDYATETEGGTIKVRLDVDTLYITTDGTNP